MNRYLCTHTHRDTHTHKHTTLHTSSPECLHTHTYTHPYTQTHQNAHTHTHTLTYKLTGKLTYTQTHPYTQTHQIIRMPPFPPPPTPTHTHTLPLLARASSTEVSLWSLVMRTLLCATTQSSHSQSSHCWQKEHAWLVSHPVHFCSAPSPISDPDAGVLLRMKTFSIMVSGVNGSKHAGHSVQSNEDMFPVTLGLLQENWREFTDYFKLAWHGYI